MNFWKKRNTPERGEKSAEKSRDMTLGDARATILELLRKEGKAKNSDMIAAIGGDAAIFEKVREALIFDDLAEDKKGVGLTYTGTAAPSASGATAVVSAGQACDIPQVFISYASPDEKIAISVLQELEKQGIKCWFAPRELPGRAGDLYADGLIEAIYSVKAMLVVFSSHSNNSPFVNREVDRAVSRRIPVIPVRVQDYAPQGAMEFYLAVPQWLNAYPPPFEKHLGEIASTVRRCLERAGESPPQKATASEIAAVFRKADPYQNPSYAAFWLGSRFAAALSLMEEATRLPESHQSLLGDTMRTAAGPYEKIAGLKTGFIDGIHQIIRAPDASRFDAIKQRYWAGACDDIERKLGTHAASWLAIGMGISSLFSQVKHGGTSIPLNLALAKVQHSFDSIDKIIQMENIEDAYTDVFRELRQRFQTNSTDLKTIGPIIGDLSIATELYLLTGRCEIELDWIQPVIEQCPLFSVYCLNRYVEKHPQDARGYFLLQKAALVNLVSKEIKLDPLFPLDIINIFARALEGTMRLEPGTENETRARTALKLIEKFRKRDPSQAPAASPPQQNTVPGEGSPQSGGNERPKNIISKSSVAMVMDTILKKGENVRPVPGIPSDHMAVLVLYSFSPWIQKKDPSRAQKELTQAITEYVLGNLKIEEQGNNYIVHRFRRG